MDWGPESHSDLPRSFCLITNINNFFSPSSGSLPIAAISTPYCLVPVCVVNRGTISIDNNKLGNSLSSSFLSFNVRIY